MNNAAALYGVVDLDNVRQNNMVYIDLGKQLQESIFERQYKMAARLGGDIITKCDKQLCDDLNACVKCTRTKCDDCIHYEKRDISLVCILRFPLSATVVPEKLP